MDVLTGGLEENIIAAIVWHTDQAMAIMLKVPVKLFGSRVYRNIATAAYDYIERYQKSPGIHLADLLERERANGEQGRALDDVIDRMHQIRDHINYDYLTEALDDFIDHQTVSQALENAMELLSKGKLAEAKAAMTQSAISGTKALEPGVWLHETQFFDFLDPIEEQDVFSSGIQLLDERHIRPDRGELMLMIGSTGRGKSWWLIGIGKAAVQNRQRVLHITLELSQKKTQKRYTQAFFSMTQRESEPVQTQSFRKDQYGHYESIDIGEFQAKGLNSETRDTLEERLKTKRLHINKRLHVKQFPTGTLTTAGLDAYLEMLKRGGWEPDIVLLDYANLMQVDAKNLRIDTGRLFRDLRGIAMARNLAMVTVTQGNRESETIRSVSKTNVAEDWSIPGTCDVVLTFSQTPEELERSLARISVEKARDNTDHWTAHITQNYRIGQFCTDSVHYDQSLQESLSPPQEADGPQRKRRSAR